MTGFSYVSHHPGDPHEKENACKTYHCFNAYFRPSSRNDDQGPQLIEPAATSPGPRVAIESLFLPAEARSACQSAFLGATLRIQVKPAPPESPRPKLVAPDVAARQRRRKTWRQNLDRYRLPEGSEVRINVAAGDTLRAMLRDIVPRKTLLGATG